MGLDSGRHLWRAATVSFFFWLFVWLLAFAILPFSGARFSYLFFASAEPLLFLLVFLGPDRSHALATAVLVLAVIHFGLHVTELVLRVLLIGRPFTVDNMLDLIFILLAAGGTFLAAWYALCAYRHYQFTGAVPTETSRAALPTDETAQPAGQYHYGEVTKRTVGHFE